MRTTSTAVALQCGPAQLEDLAAVNALELAAFAPPVYPLYFFRQAYDLWPQLFWLARDPDSNEVLAYLIAAPELTAPERLNLMSLAVSPQAQGKGVGRQLLGSFIASLASQPRHYQALWLTVDPQNLAAQQLYRQFGFVTTARRADYYGPGYDRDILTLQLGEN